MTAVLQFDTQRMAEDLAARGWTRAQLAKRAKVSKRRVDYFLSGDFQTAATNAKLAAALGKSPARYLVRSNGDR